MNDSNSFEYLCALIDNEVELGENPSRWLPWTFQATLAARTTPPRAPPLGKRAPRAASASQASTSSPASP
jgi:hypothetical protein